MSESTTGSNDGDPHNRLESVATLNPRLEEKLRVLGLDLETPPGGQHVWRSLLTRLSRTYDTEFADPSSGPSAQRLVATAPELIFSLSAEDGRITTLNPAFESLTGYPRNAWIGRSLTPLIHPSDLERTFAHLEEALKGRTPPIFEARLRTHSGAVCSTEIAVSPLRQGSRVVGIRGTARDLVRVSRRPTTADRIADLLEDIRDEILRAIDQDEDAGTTHECLENLTDRLGDLIHFSVQSSQLEKQPVDLRQILEEIVESHDDLPIEHQAHLADERPLLGNRDRLLRLLGGLIDRILHWSPSPAIHLFAESRLIRPGLCEVLFSVSARADAERGGSLEPKLHRTANTTGDLNRRLIEGMGGEIKSASHGEDEWRCMFTLRMALQDRSGTEAATNGRDQMVAAASRPGASKATVPLDILVAEDDSVPRKILTLMLERLGHRCRNAADGLDVLDGLKLRQYDAVMLSEELPEFSTLDTCRAIHDRWSSDRRPSLILMATSFPPPEDLAELVDGILHKPIQLQELQKCLARTLADKADADDADDEDDGSQAVRLGPLIQLHALRPDMVEQLVGNFLDNATEQVDTILQAASRNDLDEVRDVAHSLKGSSSTLGAIHLSEICLKLEKHGKDGSDAVPEDDLNLLRERLDHVRTVFKGQLATWAEESAAGA